jgi:uncharacterized protein YunC (DUF1805 family)
MSASLDKGVRVLKEMIDAPIASYFSSCVHCGICAEAWRGAGAVIGSPVNTRGFAA